MRVSGGNILEENKSLNNKYQSIGEEDLVIEEPLKEEKPEKEKEKKVKEPKPPKEKKVKEPKPPKEKKVKEPKPPKEKKVKEPKSPKEKKVKEPKPPKVKKEKAPKEKKVKEEKKPLFAKKEEAPQPEVVVRETASGRRTEEIILPTIKSVKMVSEEKPPKAEKPKKEKVQKVKEPKAPKEKKVKEPKPEKVKAPKEKKVKEQKSEKTPKVKKEKAPREPLNKKDFITIGFAAFAVLMIAVVVGFYFVSNENPGVNTPEVSTEETGEKLSDIQIVQTVVGQNIVQSDFRDIFFGFSESNYELRYYQYANDKMTQVKATNSVTTSVNMGNEDVPVTIDYIKVGD